MGTLLKRHVGVVEVDRLYTGGNQLRNIGSKLHHQLELYMEYTCIIIILDNTKM